MPRSKHDEYFARLFAQQAAGRDRFTAGVKVDDQRAKADAGRVGQLGNEPCGRPGGERPGAASSAPIYPLVGLCRTAGLPIPTPEHQFHPTRGWQFDYAWPLHLVALEIEGGIWKKGGGAHSHPLNIERDLEKYSEAAILGWRVLRVPPEALRTRGMDYLFRIFAVPTKGKGP